MPAQQAKNWCFTLNNYQQDDVDSLEALGTELPEPIRYLVFGFEVGESGTPHLQGFISFSKKITLARAKEFVSCRSHLEVAKGSPKQASDYCKKDQDFREYGNCPGGQGSRSDLVRVAGLVREGKKLSEIAEEAPESFIKYSTGILRLRMLYRPDREGPPTISVFYGPTGTGKTSRVHTFVNSNELWIHPGRTGGSTWFDGYDNHRVVLFDDFDGSWFQLGYLLKLLDRYVFKVPVKCGFTWWCPKQIYITSNLKPEEWYPSAHERQKAALLRRLREFGTVVECT